MIKLSEVQFKICTKREMQMHFQYIKCWLDKGFNKLDKINKKSRIFFCVIYNSGILRVLLQGIKYMGLVVRTCN